MADEDDDVVAAKPKAKKKNPLAAKAKATATKVIEKASKKPVGKATAAKEEKPKRAAKGEGPGKRQPSEDMQEQRTALLALLKRRKNGLTSVEAARELEWTSAQMAATSFGLVRSGQLEKEKDPESGRVTFKYAG